MTIDQAIERMRAMLARGPVRIDRLSPMGRDVAAILAERGEAQIAGRWVSRV